MKAHFFRNVTDFKSLCYYQTHYEGIIGEYCVIATITLDSKESATFLGNFQQSFAYLETFIDSATIINGIWNCVSVSGKDWTLLVVMDHYQYPRYLAIMPKSRDL